MKKYILLLAFLLNCKSDDKIVSVKFSPKGGITETIVNTISEADTSVRVQAFSFTSKAIANALIEAKTSGKTIEVIMDRENLYNKSSVLKLLREHDVTIFIDDKHAIAHNKIMLIDEDKIFTGSFNFTKGGEEHNAENSILIQDKNTASLYLDNWMRHKNHSYEYKDK